MDQLDFTPADAKGLISDPTSSLCGNFVKSLLQLPVYFWKLVSFFFDADGKFKNPGVVGEVRCFAVAAPAGWLECNGAAVSRTTYSDLFTAVATLFGVGDGSTTFNVPDLRDHFVKGKNAEVIGAVQGAATVTLAEDEMPVHSHTGKTYARGAGPSLTKSTAAWGADVTFFHENAGHTTATSGDAGPDGVLETDDAGGDTGVTQPHENMPPSVSLYYYIYAGQTA